MMLLLLLLVCGKLVISRMFTYLKHGQLVNFIVVVGLKEFLGFWVLGFFPVL
jgi:hypothetical protein